MSSLFSASQPSGNDHGRRHRGDSRALGGEKPARVLIDGEEDLLAIPAIEAAPLGSALYYGQPGEGVVVVTVDERARASAKRIMAAMKKETD